MPDDNPVDSVLDQTLLLAPELLKGQPDAAVFQALAGCQVTRQNLLTALSAVSKLEDVLVVELARRRRAQEAVS